MPSTPAHDWWSMANVSVCSAGDDPRDGFQLVAIVEVAGVPTSMLIDTGSGDSYVTPNSEAAASLVGEVAQETTTFVSVAGEIRTEVHTGVQLRVGGASLRARIATLALASACDSDGVLGWDVLQRCSLAIWREGGALRCSDQAPLTHRAPAIARAPVALRSVHAEPACGLTDDEVQPRLGFELPVAFASGRELYTRIMPGLRAVASSFRTECNARGWLRAEVQWDLLRLDGAEADARIVMVTGPRFVVSALSIVSSPSGTEHEEQPFEDPALAALETRVHAPYDPRALDRDVARILAIPGVRDVAIDIVDDDAGIVEVRLRVSR